MPSRKRQVRSNLPYEELAPVVRQLHKAGLTEKQVAGYLYAHYGYSRSLSEKIAAVHYPGFGRSRGIPRRFIQNHDRKGVVRRTRPNAMKEYLAQIPGLRKLQAEGFISHGTATALTDYLRGLAIPGKEFKAGIRHEMEHTRDPMVAGMIALDHLKETPDYYSRLKRAGL